MTATITSPVSPDLRTTLRALKLGQMPGTLPERLTLARQQKMTHADFLELILADEVTRREARSAEVRYDRQLWNELASLRFLDGPHGTLILGPVGVGKTHLASALGHITVRRRRTVHMAPAARLFKRLRAARLDNTLEAEMRRLAASSCSSWTTSRSSPSTPPRPPTSTSSASSAPQGRHGRDLEPDGRGVAVHDGRPLLAQSRAGRLPAGPAAAAGTGY